MLEPEKVDDWLGSLADTDQIAGYLRPAADGPLNAHSVDPRIDNTRNDDPWLIVLAFDTYPDAPDSGTCPKFRRQRIQHARKITA